MLDPRTVFESDGPLARELDGYAYRESQAQVAALVWDALGQRRTLAVEAGTGIGKTFAYLVPVLLAGQRAVISTGTKTLQDQLYGRDLPALAGAIGRPVTVALLKGRGNYLCWHRLAIAQRGDFGAASDLGGLGALERWGRVSDSGDLNDYTDLSDGFARKSWVTSTADNCLGGDCDWLDDCFVVKARRSALAADVVVVNHHLLLADLALKDAGFGELLPGAEAIVVDEAHLLPEIAQYFFGISVGTRELDALRSDAIAEARSAGLADALEPLADRLGRAVAEARMRAATLDGRTPWAAAPAALKQCIDEWRGVLGALTEALEGVRDGSAGLERAHERGADLSARLTTLAEPDEDGLRWLEPGERSLALHWTPLDTGRALGERIRMHGGTWVFASATLAVGENFDHFMGRVGVDDADTAVLASPFDFERNARLYLPEGLPAPSVPDFTATLLSHVCPLIEAAGGGAFLLFTSYRALGEAERWLAGRELPGPLLVQGQGGRTELLEEFPRCRQRRIARDQQFLAGRRRPRRGAQDRHHRQAAVRLARRPANQRTACRYPRGRRQSVHGVSASSGRADPQAGRRSADPRLR